MTAIVTIGDLFSFRKGKKPTALLDTPVKDARSFYQIGELRGEVDPRYAVDPNGTDVNENDICIVWDGANAGTVGYGVNGLIGSTISRLRQKSAHQIFTPYLGRFLQSKFNELNSTAQGAAIPHIDGDKLRNLELHLPGLEEQKRISAILDKADAIRRKRQQAIQLANDFLRSVFLDMFSSASSASGTWPEITIDDLLADVPNAIRTGPFGSQLKHSEFTAEGIPVLGIDNIVTNEFRMNTKRCLPMERFEEFKRYVVRPDDVIVTIMGTTGRVAVAPKDVPVCMSTKHLCVMTLDKNKVDPYFLWATLIFDYKVRQQAKISSGGAIMEGWNMGIIKSLSFKLPPIKRQLEYRRKLEKYRDIKTTATSTMKESIHLFESLAQRAFRGEL